MKNMLSVLVGRSFRASKMRNLIAVLAIMLTAILFTTVTTIGMGAMDSMTLTMQMQKGSRSDGDFRNMTSEQYEALADADFIKEYGLRMPVGFLTNTNRTNVEFDVLDETQADLTFCAPSHGNIPQTENEIVTSDAALRDLGVEPEVGATVTIAFTAHGQEYQMDMVVSGWFEATNDQISMMWAGTAFRDAHPDIFEYTYDKDRVMTGTYYSDFIATSTVGLQENLDNWVSQMGGNPDASSSDTLSAAVNTMTNPTMEPTTIFMGAVIIILFVFCGYLLIYNVFDIAVMQEIRRYGLYRTVGMSKRQVKKLINRQALWLSCIGIPLGLLVGYFIGKAALPKIMNIFSSEYESVAVNVEPSPIIFVGAAVLAAFTVFLSTRKPVRVAANIPPIEAFRYVEAATGKRTMKKSTAGTSLPRLAWSNLGRNKRRSIFIVISLTLCVVLLNCVGIAADSVDIEKQVSYTIRTDYVVVNSASTNRMEGFTLRENERTNMTVFLENYITQVDTSLNYLSADSARENAQATRTMLQFVGGLIGIIFGVAGVLNLTNTIITTILARRHEFATMQSIGMTTKQLTQMMIWEGVYYAIGACIVGLILSMVLAYTVVRVLTGSIWYFTFHFTLLPAIIPCVVLLIVAAIVPVIALKVFNKGSIVEKLRVAE